MPCSVRRQFFYGIEVEVFFSPPFRAGASLTCTVIVVASIRDIAIVLSPDQQLKGNYSTRYFTNQLGAFSGSNTFTSVPFVTSAISKLTIPELSNIYARVVCCTACFRFSKLL